MKRILLLLPLLALTACPGSLPTVANVEAATTATVSQAQADLQTAINLYGVAKGIGQIASLANPAVGAVVTGITSFADPVVAQAQVALNDATTDAASIEALVTQITAQANNLTLKAAPAITVVPNPTPASSLIGVHQARLSEFNSALWIPS